MVCTVSRVDPFMCAREKSSIRENSSLTPILIVQGTRQGKSQPSKYNRGLSTVEIPRLTTRPRVTCNLYEHEEKQAKRGERMATNVLFFVYNTLDDGLGIARRETKLYRKTYQTIAKYNKNIETYQKRFKICTKPVQKAMPQPMKTAGRSAEEKQSKAYKKLIQTVTRR